MPGKRTWTWLAFVIVIAMTWVGCSDLATGPQGTDEVPYEGVPIDGRYIVTLQSGAVDMKAPASVSAAAGDMLRQVGASQDAVTHLYAYSVSGFSAEINADQAARLAEHPSVKRVEKDRFVMLRPPWEDPEPDPSTGQQVPYGITRVGGATVSNGTAWVIDTGIDFEATDLNVDIARSVFFGRAKSPDDDNGHGTHVAGTIAAIDNNEGVVGVAAGATVVAVKVLDRRGSGAISDIIAGVDYAAANAGSGDVANMSLGGGISPSLDDAVLAASETGLMFALAAGNESDDANNHSPARINGSNIWTVSAIDEADVFAYFSNYGNPPIDFAAPGVSVLSLSHKGGLATMSGTSMASPHVAGLLLVTGGNITTDGYAIGDPDGNPDPIAHN